MQRRILFVDDEPNLLMGLQRNLHTMREQWDMEFVSSGEAALQAMACHPFDVVVTDMRMPCMTGAELLNKIQEQFPQTIRIILSGQSDRLSILRSIAPAHQFLSKPCDTDQLRSHLARAIALTDLLENTALKAYVSRLKGIPSLPSLYHEITQELGSADPSPARIGRIVAQDMGMTAKILQLVNSAMYGLRREISKPEQAVLFLGLDTIQSLVLSLSVFSDFEPDVLGAHQTEQLWEHSVCSSKFAKAIAHVEGVDGSAADPYLSAGLLHDIGKLIMASANPEEYRRVTDLAASTGTSLWLREKEVLGCSHAEVGAYLLGIWGLPASIVEAVAWHHHPSDSAVTQFSPLVAVHAASALHTKIRAEVQTEDPVLDQAFLNQIELVGREPVWMQCCRDLQQRELAV